MSVTTNFIDKCVEATFTFDEMAEVQMMLKMAEPNEFTQYMANLFGMTCEQSSEQSNSRDG